MKGRILKGKERAKRLAQFKRAIKEGKVEIGNKAVTEKKTPYIQVFKYEAGKDTEGTPYEAAEGFTISWSDPSCGFGEISFRVKNGQLEIRSEHMGWQFIGEQITKLLDSAKLVD
jgi:hypothetical protein